MIAGVWIAAALLAQNFEQRGFVESATTLYPQTAQNDNGHAVEEALVRWEPSYKLASWLRIYSAIDLRTDTHRQAERWFRLDAGDRSVQRPAFSLRRLSASIHQGKITLEIGRQFIRWGKADILNPT